MSSLEVRAAMQWEHLLSCHHSVWADAWLLVSGDAAE